MNDPVGIKEDGSALRHVTVLNKEEAASQSTSGSVEPLLILSVKTHDHFVLQGFFYSSSSGR